MTISPISLRWHLTTFLLCLFLSISFSLHAQKAQALHWYFGDHYGMDFSSGAPVTDFSSSIYTYEACATMSNKEGNLLFYTNGGGRANQAINGYIWNRNHEIMDGGDLGFEKGGGYSAAQGAITFKKPGTENIYCLFTVDEKETTATNNSMFPKGKGAKYFEIDMNANNGLGAVSLSNQPLFTPAFEYQAATVHQNCDDYWLVVPTGYYHLFNDPQVADSFYVYLVDNNGPTLAHKTPIPEGLPFAFDEYGPLKISPDGQWLISGGHLYSFDNSTGYIEHQQNLQYNGLNYKSATAFSPNGKLLYEINLQPPPTLDSASIFQITQYDLDSSNFLLSEIVYTNIDLVPYAYVGGPQLASDGKLYFILQNGHFNSATSLAVINNPNEKGMAVEVNLNVLDLTNIPDSRFLRLGNYSDHIFYNEPHLNEQGNDSIVIDCQLATDLFLTAPPGKDCYFWSTGATEESIVATEEGLYWVEYWSECMLEADSFFLIYDNNIFEVDLGADIILCNSDSVVLIAPEYPDLTYQWQDGSETSSLIANEAGTYHITLEQNRCTARDTIVITQLSLPELSLGEDFALCFNNTKKLNVVHPNWDSYRWQDGSEESFFEVSEAGIYSVTTENYCGSSSDEIEVFYFECSTLCPSCETRYTCPVYVPTSFSPNGDSNNDFFKVYSPCTFIGYRFQIFDRWGSQVFGSSDPQAGWDGLLKGQLCQVGSYAYKLEMKWLDVAEQLQEELVYGEVVLLR